jgi:uncharacterized membrane protein (UPF0136 family)
VRRLLLGSVVGIISADSASSAVMGILVSTFFFGLFFKLQPYRERRDNHLNQILAYSLTLLFLAALMLKVMVRCCACLNFTLKTIHTFLHLTCYHIYIGDICLTRVHILTFVVRVFIYIYEFVNIMHLY